MEGIQSIVNGCNSCNSSMLIANANNSGHNKEAQNGQNGNVLRVEPRILAIASTSTDSNVDSNVDSSSQDSSNSSNSLNSLNSSDIVHRSNRSNSGKPRKKSKTNTKSVIKSNKLCKAVSPFGHPTGLDDVRWKWRNELQNCKLSQESRNHTFKILCQNQNCCETNDNNMNNNNKKNSNSNNDNGCKYNQFEKMQKRYYIETMLCKRALKFGCPKHELIPLLIKHGYHIQHSKYSMCNGYSQLCCKELKFNKELTIKPGTNFETGSNFKSNSECTYTNSNCHLNSNFIKQRLVEVTRLSFQDVGIIRTSNTTIDAPLKIEFNPLLVSTQNTQLQAGNENSNEKMKDNINTNINMNNICILFDILRTDEAAFAKRFRPGLYQYNGSNDHDGRDKEKDKDKDKDKSTKTSKDKQMGTWVCYLYVCDLCLGTYCAMLPSARVLHCCVSICLC